MINSAHITSGSQYGRARSVRFVAKSDCDWGSGYGGLVSDQPDLFQEERVPA
jgi:hypothetical protein